jgi:hypothetical protein
MAAAVTNRPKQQLSPVDVLLEVNREADRENIQIIRSALLAVTLGEPFDVADLAAALRDTGRDPHWWDGYCKIAKQYAGLRTEEQLDQLLAKASKARDVAGREEREAQQAYGKAIDKSKAARSAWGVLMNERKEKSQLRAWNPLICGDEDEALAALPAPAVSQHEADEMERRGQRPYEPHPHHKSSSVPQTWRTGK